ncbi:MAG: major capsid protein [Treponema sp.]|nr:major capsid protein [Treponema sp.]
MAIIIKPNDIERIIAANAPEELNAMNYFSNRPLKNSTHIAVAELEAEYGNVPVIKRGALGVRPESGISVKVIEPMPIEIDDTFTAVEIDDYERATDTGKQQMIDDKISNHLRVVRSTTRALCAQAHRGNIDYMMQAGTAMSRYLVDYGDIKGIPLPDTLNNLTIARVVVILQQQTLAIRDQGIGGAIEFIASLEVFQAIVKAGENQKSYTIVPGPGKVSVAGFEILVDNDSWIDIDSNGVKTTKYMVEPLEIMARAVNAGQKLPYLRLDDVVMPYAVPFYAFTKARTDQRGEDLYVKSKPFPLINRKGIVFAKFAS